MEKYNDLEFKTKKEMFRFMAGNRDKLIAQKKAVMKKGDCPVIISPVIVHEPKIATKKAAGEIIEPEDIKSLNVEVVINTTNFMDSHDDVHLPGIWNRSLQNNKMLMHLQEHRSMEFSKIIADGDELKAYTKTFSWKELGYDYKGNTEALIFESEILRKRNEYMMLQYANEWVRNHSVGMYYVKLDIAINDEDYPNEYEAWEKYYPEIANSELPDEKGYFWYVMEAKLIEGSSVPLGSNIATPTISTGKNEPEIKKTGIDYKYIREGLKK